MSGCADIHSGSCTYRNLSHRFLHALPARELQKWHRPGRPNWGRPRAPRRPVSGNWHGDPIHARRPMIFKS